MEGAGFLESDLLGDVSNRRVRHAEQADGDIAPQVVLQALIARAFAL